jgi:hypothetical protein
MNTPHSNPAHERTSLLVKDKASESTGWRVMKPVALTLLALSAVVVTATSTGAFYIVPLGEEPATSGVLSSSSSSVAPSPRIALGSDDAASLGGSQCSVDGASTAMPLHCVEPQTTIESCDWQTDCGVVPNPDCGDPVAVTGESSVEVSYASDITACATACTGGAAGYESCAAATQSCSNVCSGQICTKYCSTWKWWGCKNWANSCYTPCNNVCNWVAGACHWVAEVPQVCVDSSWEVTCRKHATVYSGKCLTCMYGYELNDDGTCDLKEGSEGVAGLKIEQYGETYFNSVTLAPMTPSPWDIGHSALDDATAGIEQTKNTIAVIGDGTDMVLDSVVDAAGEVADFSAAALAGVEDAADIVKAFFGEDSCDLDAEMLQNTLSDMITHFPDGALNVAKQWQDVWKAAATGNESPDNKFSNAMVEMDDALCASTWLALDASSVMVTALSHVIFNFAESCPAIMGDSAYVATISLTASAEFTLEAGGVDRTLSAGGDLGIGIARDGTKFCYVSGCYGSGYSASVVDIGLDTIFDAGFEFTISVFNDIASVPGSSVGHTFNAGIDIYTDTSGTTKGGGGAMSVITMTGADDSIFTEDERTKYVIGLSAPIGFGSSLMPSIPQAEVGYTRDYCLTPICVTTDGVDCGDVIIGEDIGAGNVKDDGVY